MPTPPRLRPVLLATLAAAALATAACGGPDGSDAADTTTPSTSSPSASVSSSASPSESGSPSPSASESTSAAVPEGFSTDEQRSSSWPRLGPRVGTGVAVRVGRHSGYDRVVYEFSGSGVPTYQVHYVDEPKDSVSGDEVDVPGDAYLAVGVTTVGTPGGDSTPPSDPSDASLEGTVVTYAPAIWGGFEGVGEQFIGISGEQRPFRVSTLEDPSRLVVDIAK